MTAPAGARTVLYDTQELIAVIDEMARQANGLLHGASQVAVIGVLRRGAPLADRLTTRLMELYGLPQPLRLDLQVKRYADDLTLLHPQTQLTEQAQHAALDLRDYTVLVVDDVLYTGHSLLKVAISGAQAASGHPGGLPGGPRHHPPARACRCGGRPAWHRPARHHRVPCAAV